jgi:hypothetical protein
MVKEGSLHASTGVNPMQPDHSNPLPSLKGKWKEWQGRGVCYHAEAGTSHLRYSENGETI